MVSYNDNCNIRTGKSRCFVVVFQIIEVWENEGWPMPVVEESYNPDRTRLSLEFAKKQTIKTNDKNKR